MEHINALSQMLQIGLGILPGNFAAGTISFVTLMVTLCTLILRFWSEPAPTSNLYWVWKLVHIIASFKIPTSSMEQESQHDKTD